MSPLDFAKAGGVALVLLILNLLIAIGSVVVYSYAVEPGHPREFYDQAAQWIVPWAVHTIGTAFFLIAAYLFARRNPARNGIVFALVIVAFYALVDLASVGFLGMSLGAFLLSMLLKLFASLTGAFLAIRTNSA